MKHVHKVLDATGICRKFNRFFIHGDAQFVPAQDSDAEYTIAVREDMGFHRFLLRTAVKVEVEWTLLSLVYNMLKLHHKIQTGHLGTGLVVPKGFPAGL